MNYIIEDNIIKGLFDKTHPKSVVRTLNTNFLTKQIYKSHNRLGRYQKRLLKEGLQVISNSGRNVTVVESIEDRIDVSNILEFSKETLPSLYRRYLDLRSKYEVLIENL